MGVGSRDTAIELPKSLSILLFTDSLFSNACFEITSGDMYTTCQYNLKAEKIPTYIFFGMLHDISTTNSFFSLTLWS